MVKEKFKVLNLEDFKKKKMIKDITALLTTTMPPYLPLTIEDLYLDPRRIYGWPLAQKALPLKFIIKVTD